MLIHEIGLPGESKNFLLLLRFCSLEMIWGYGPIGCESVRKSCLSPLEQKLSLKNREKIFLTRRTRWVHRWTWSIYEWSNGPKVNWWCFLNWKFSLLSENDHSITIGGHPEILYPTGYQCFSKFSRRKNIPKVNNSKKFERVEIKTSSAGRVLRRILSSASSSPDA